MEPPTENLRSDVETCNLQEEAHFAFSSSNWLLNKSNISEDVFLRYIDYSIRHNENDLLSHVRKVFFCQKNRRSDIIGSAIKALFSSLGNNGQQLKTSILTSSKHLISKEEYLHLRTMIDSTTADTKEQKPKPQNLESTKNTDTTLGTASAIAESFIENGQLNEAMDYLEDHLLKNDENLELSKTLASIYTLCNEKKRLKHFSRKLSNNGKVVPNCFNIDEKPHHS